MQQIKFKKEYFFTQTANYKQSYYRFTNWQNIFLMYDRLLNQSQTSFTTNSSKTARIVRKRDSNLSGSFNRSKSKGKQDQANTSFQQYLSKQTKFFNVENVQTIQYEFNEQKSKVGKIQKIQRISNGSTPFTLSQTLSNVQISRTSLIQRGDRYIQPKNGIRVQKAQIPNVKQATERKRSPTPVKSRKQLKTNQINCDSQATNSQIFQLQLRIQGLQQILNLQRKQKQKVDAQVKQITKQKTNLQQILKQMEIQNKILLNEKKTLQQKIIVLQKSVLQSQNNLNVAQNNLNKLRQTIKQNRINELQSQMKKQVNINQNLANQLTKMKQQNIVLVQQIKHLLKEAQKNKQNSDVSLFMKQQSMKQQYLTKQIQNMKKQYQIFKKTSRNQKEMILQDKIKNQGVAIYHLQEQVNKYLVKIYCLQYLKQKQIKEIKQKNESELKSLRIRYSKMVNELKKKSSTVKNVTNQIGNTRKVSPNKNQNSPSKATNNSHSSYNIVCKSSITILGSPSSLAGGSVLTNSNSYNKDMSANNSECSPYVYRPNSIANRGLLANNNSCNDRNQEFCLLELSPE